jgi:hypothetical protein
MNRFIQALFAVFFVFMLPLCASAAGPACDGVTDDTATIQAELNNAANQLHPETVSLPEGTCLIESTLVIGAYGSLVGSGNGTTILANYAKWRATNGDYDAIELTSSGAMPDQRFMGNRRISGFLLQGSGNSAVVSTGIKVFYTGGAAGSAVAGQFALISFDHLLVSDFDTGIDLSDLTASSMSSVSISAVRQGVVIRGLVYNLQMNHVEIQYASASFTPAGGQGSYGISVTSKGYGNGTGYPQGIELSDSAIVAYDNDLAISYCSSCKFHDNILDYGGDGTLGSGVTVAIGLISDFQLRGNYIANTTSSGALVSVANPNNDNNNIWIEDNTFTSYASSNNATGISFSGGSGQNRGVHLNHNSFLNLWQGVSIDHPIAYSTIIGNHGETITSYLINLNGSFNQSLPGLFVDGNTDSDSVPVVNVGSATGYKLGWNASPTQTTP